MPGDKDNPKNKPSRPPKFANEAEEARWWFEHQDELADRFAEAAKAGTLGRGTLSRRDTPPLRG